MYEEMRATNDNGNELEMWENVSCPYPRQCLVICMPILIKRGKIRNCYLQNTSHKCHMPHFACSTSDLLTNPV